MLAIIYFCFKNNFFYIKKNITLKTIPIGLFYRMQYLVIFWPKKFESQPLKGHSIRVLYGLNYGHSMATVKSRSFRNVWNLNYGKMQTVEIFQTYFETI